MKFIADECCDTGIVISLRREGHDVFYVLEEEPGLQDEVILQRAYVERRVLLTEDKDSKRQADDPLYSEPSKQINYIGHR